MQTAAPHDRSFALSDGSVLAYTLHPAPAAGAPRIVLIHSLALDRSVWDGVVERLRSAAEILVYDCRGHGRSDRRATRFTAELFAHDLAELLDHVGWQKATIAGCSLGGCVALAFGGLYPQRAAALGLIDTTAWYGPDAAAKFRERADAARAKGMQGLIEFQATRWFSDEFRATHPDVLERATAVFLANDFDCYASTCALLGDVDVRSHLPSFRMPVTIVVGEEDYATPVDMARQLHEAIPAARLTVLPRARHLTPLEHPDRVASELLDLVQRT
jgi:3-oxoadipate enol-lactonase